MNWLVKVIGFNETDTITKYRKKDVIERWSIENSIFHYEITKKEIEKWNLEETTLGNIAYFFCVNCKNKEKIEWYNSDHEIITIASIGDFWRESVKDLYQLSRFYWGEKKEVPIELKKAMKEILKVFFRELTSCAGYIHISSGTWEEICEILYFLGSPITEYVSQTTIELVLSKLLDEGKIKSFECITQNGIIRVNPEIQAMYEKIKQNT